MSTEIDPEGQETNALFAAANFRGARVLEVGCGAGRLTRRYAAVVRYAAGVDPALEELTTAKRDWQADRTRRPAFAQAGASALPFAAEAFDIVVFGWSL